MFPFIKFCYIFIKIQTYGNSVFICIFLFPALGISVSVLLSPCSQWTKRSISIVLNWWNDTQLVKIKSVQLFIHLFVTSLSYQPSSERGTKTYTKIKLKITFQDVKLWDDSWTREIMKWYLHCIIHQFPHTCSHSSNSSTAKFPVLSSGGIHGTRSLSHWEQNRNTDFIHIVLASISLCTVTCCLISQSTQLCLCTRKKPLTMALRFKNTANTIRTLIKKLLYNQATLQLSHSLQ